MKIAIDVTPIAETSGHKVRGTGFYIQHLKKALLEYFPDNDYVFFNSPTEIKTDTTVVHYPYFEPFFLTLPRKRLAKKTIVTVHDVTPLVFPEHFPSGIKGKLRFFLQKNALQKVSNIITDSEASKKDIVKFCAIPESKIEVVYLAAGEEYKKLSIPETEKKALQQKYNLPEKFVLYVGDVTWNKNLPRLIRAIRKTDIPLVMVGKALVQKNIDSTNPWNKDLIEVQQLVSNSSQVQTLGFVPSNDLVSLYNLATVFIMPSLYEGFGLPILEAMNCACPVITTKEGSLAEVAGSAAHYVDAYSEENIAKGISKVFHDKNLQNSLIEKGRLQASKFSWKKTAEETMKVYES